MSLGKKIKIYADDIKTINYGSRNCEIVLICDTKYFIGKEYVDFEEFKDRLKRTFKSKNGI